MKENVFDVLIYLFENYMDDETDMSPDPDAIRTELLEAGFPHKEINKAFDCWAYSAPSRTARQSFKDCMAGAPIGTERRLPPLPNTVTSAASQSNQPADSC